MPCRPLGLKPPHKRSPLLAVFQKGPKRIRVLFPKAHQLRENPQRFRSEMVLDHLDLLLDCLPAQTQQTQQPGQGLVPHLDMIGHRPALRRKGKTTVTLVIDIAPPRSEERRVGKECRARWSSGE